MRRLTDVARRGALGGPCRAPCAGVAVVPSLPIPLRVVLAAAGLRANAGHGSAITPTQRFGSAAKLNTHLQIVLLDGTHWCGTDGATRFVEEGCRHHSQGFGTSREPLCTTVRFVSGGRAKQPGPWGRFEPASSRRAGRSRFAAARWPDDVQLWIALLPLTGATAYEHHRVLMSSSSSSSLVRSKRATARHGRPVSAPSSAHSRFRLGRWPAACTFRKARAGPRRLSCETDRMPADRSMAVEAGPRPGSPHSLDAPGEGPRSDPFLEVAGMQA